MIWLMFLVALFSLVVLARALFFLVNVDGHSMVPTLDDGDRVLVLRLWRTTWLRKGQIVVTRYVATPWNPKPHPLAAQQERYIKRIIGMEGDTVVTHLSDLPVPIQERLQPRHDDRGERTWQVPPGHCFVKGDSYGLDSTIIGPVPVDAVLGIMLTKLKPRRRSPREETIPQTQPHRIEQEKASSASDNLSGHRHSEKP